MGAMSLARALSARNVPYRLFDAASELKTSSLAMTLDSGATPLAALLGIDVADLRSLTAVDAPLGGSGAHGRIVDALTGRTLETPAALQPGPSSFRVNNDRLRRCMAQGLDITFGRKLVGWAPDPATGGVLATLERMDEGTDGPRFEKISGSLLVCADGVHSSSPSKLHRGGS